MYERFTDRARKVVQLANQEAHRANREFVDTEHILLGLIKEAFGVAANVLINFGLGLPSARLECEKVVQGNRNIVTTGRLPQTPRAKLVIEHSMEEAHNLNHDQVGTEHILLGLLREQEGVAAQVLSNLGLNHDDLRANILNLLKLLGDLGLKPEELSRDALSLLAHSAATPIAGLRSAFSSRPNSLGRRLGRWLHGLLSRAGSIA
jgi:ATP-dependent Clp protease ATP-binding subunit ClpA